MDKENKLILYKDDEGKISVNTRFADEDVWLTQAQLVEIYQSSKSNISEHLSNIFNDQELDQDAVVRKFRTTAADGKNYQVLHYNLDVIIALGYRVQSPIAVRFRRWATQRLHEYIQKGFTMDDERLKQGGNRYFRELLQRIRDIRRVQAPYPTKRLLRRQSGSLKSTVNERCDCWRVTSTRL